MNTIGDENDSNYEPTGYEYETETSGVDTELEDSTATSEKPAKSKKGLFIAGGAIALLALAGGYFVFSGDSSPPPPRNVATQPVDVEQDAQDVADAEGLEGVDRFADSDSSLQDPFEDDFDSQDVQDFDRFGPAPADPFAGPAPQDPVMDNMDGTLDPSLLPPSSFEEGIVHQPHPQDVQGDVIVTESGDVVQDHMAQSDVVVHDETQDVVIQDEPSQVVQEDLRSFDVPRSNEIHVDHLAQFRDMLSPLDGRVTTLESKVNTLEKTVARIDRELKNMPRSSSSSKSSTSSSKSSARSSSATRSTRSDNVIRVAPPVSRVQLDSNGKVLAVTNNPSASKPVTVSQVASQVKVASAPSQSCDVQAIVPGRVWIKNADGSFQSFGEDDKWNGQDIESIDPNKGVKAGGKWHCM